MLAVKRVLAWQLRQAMESRKITKKRMAEEMMTNRSQLDRVFDPENTFFKAAKAVGRKVEIQLV